MITMIKTRKSKETPAKKRPRHYCNIHLRPNPYNSKSAPEYLSHSITSEVLLEHIHTCIKNQKPISFDIASFAVKDSNEIVITLSVPFFPKMRPTLVEDFFTDD
jgi:hypothetical protein